jgi:hypothetical protein
MKLTTVSLRRYRSIEEMDTFAIQPDVTCLVGKNESGKTAVLQSLFKSHPIEGEGFDEGLDYPTTLTAERRRAKGPIKVSTLSYQLNDEDVAAIESELGEGSLVSRDVSVSTGYRYERTTWEIELDEPAVVAHLRAKLDLPSGPQKAVQEAETVQSLVAVLEALEDANSGAKGVLDKVKKWRNSSPTLAALDILSRRRPKFVYFGEYDSMPGEVNIKELIALRDARRLSRAQQAFLSLLHMAGVEPEDFIDPESSEHMVRDVENASNGITQEVFTYWSQNQNLRVQLRMGQVQTGNFPGPTIQIRVLNEKHHVTVPFNERSQGFVWFFSFLAYFSEVEQESSSPIILLLDEPGLSLHAKAQADLLRFIDERLAPNHQVIFTTHSPFMVDPQRFERVRTVQDEDRGGTQVSQDVLRADTDTVFPLMAAMGVGLTQTLWVGPNVLLVEGPSDVIYLNYLSQRLEVEGRECLDPRWAITPGGSITKLPSFLSVFGANKMNVAVLTDSSPKDAQTVQRLKEAGRLGSGGLVQVGDVLGKEEADLEDLFTDSFYLSLVSEAYKGQLKGKELKASELPPGPRITKRVEEAFAGRGINNGRLNHFSPAGALMRKPDSFSGRMANSTLDKAEDLFGRINRFLTAE